MSFLQITFTIITVFIAIYIILAIVVKIGYNINPNPPQVPLRIGLTTLAVLVSSACTAVEMITAIVYAIIHM